MSGLILRNIGKVASHAAFGRTCVSLGSRTLVVRCHLSQNLRNSKTASQLPYIQARKKSKSSNVDGTADFLSLVQPVEVQSISDPDGINVGEELSGTLLQKGNKSTTVHRNCNTSDVAVMIVIRESKNLCFTVC